MKELNKEEIDLIITVLTYFLINEEEVSFEYFKSIEKIIKKLSEN